MNDCDLMDMQIRSFESGHKRLFDKVDDFFLGESWAQTTVGESEAALIKTSTNFVFPIVETAASALLPPNPQVTVDRDKLASKVDAAVLETVETLANHSLRTGAWVDELDLTIQSVVKYGRGIVKTTWDTARDCAVSRYVDPRAYHYDQTAVRYDDMRYEFEATILSRRDIEKKIQAGFYKAGILDDVQGDRYPMWLDPKGTSTGNRQALRNYQPWFLVYEFYDREAGKVRHYLNRKLILEDELVYRPYDILTFNFNGRDVGGISEIGLILSNQEEYNWTETFLLNILRFGIPGVLYDARALTDSQVQKLSQAPLGAYFPIQLPPNVQAIGDAFAPRPMTQVPVAAEDMLAKKRDAIAYVSAISDAARSQVVGAKTATELAFMEGNARNRLRPRQTKVDALTTAVAEKQVFLASLYRREPIDVRKPGTQSWRVVVPQTLEGVRATFKMVPYSPAETNKAVKVETLRNLQSMLVGNPNVNQRKLTAKFLNLLDEEDLLLSEEEVQASLAAAQPAQGTPPNTGAMPGGETPSVADQPSPLPPRAAAFSDAVAAPTAPDAAGPETA